MKVLRFIFSVEKNELKILLLSFCFIFMLFNSYALLRPMRDALGTEGGEEELRWLFLATFIYITFISILMVFVSSRIKKKAYIDAVFLFFASNLAIFYILFLSISHEDSAFIWLARVFYVWVSVFNLPIFSTAWSLLVDIFSKERSKRLFALIASGASLGNITGALCVSLLSSNINILVCASLLLLIGAIVFKNLIIKEARSIASEDFAQEIESKFAKPIDAKNPFIGFKLIIESKYLLLLSVFILLLTSVSTFLYVEQARIIKQLFPTIEARVAAFANIDLIVQSMSLFIQIFLTAKIARFFGLSSLLGTLGFVLGFGFIVLAFLHPAFLPFVIVMSIRRVGEYALVKPGREMLYVPLDENSKYKVKNFIDTVVYRGGDMLSSQVEALLANLGIVVVLLCGALISFVWGALGVFLGKNYEKF